MASSKVTKDRHKDNGEALKATTPPPADEARDAQLLQEAVNDPGVAEIPEAKAQAGPMQVTEIPSVVLDPDSAESGQPLEQDPALMTVSLGRPSPHGWVRVYPAHFLRTVLLAYKPHRDSSPEYHYVIPELQGPLQKELKQVRVYLLSEAVPAGEFFLWIVGETEFSPYHNGMMRLLAKGPEFVKAHKFLFGRAELKQRSCPLSFKALGPDDPDPTPPSRPISLLLPEALRRERIITTTSHPVYLSLTSGKVLG
jgi:hypothetical protein